MTRQPNASMSTGPARRGSALLIVIGILALIAVLGAIYISIGQSDTRSASAVQQRARTTAIQERVAEYAASVVARDRLDTFFAPSSTTASGFNGQLEFREAIDYPYTDWTRRSVLLGGVQAWDLFDAVGGNGIRFNTYGSGSEDDRRVASDPWLSSTEPEYLGPLAWEIPGSRVFSRDDPRFFWLDNRDWRQISNLAPDGRFVNLYNLRPEARFEGFDTPPGVGEGTMTYGLSLLVPREPGNYESPLRAFDPVGGGIWVPGVDQPVSSGMSADELYNTPAVWTMYQRYAFIPMNQPFFIYGRNGAVADWSSPDYPAYQWADADGDGMADSRWFELVDASDPDNIIRLTDDPDYRVFVAARVMDLSALVNVNVASDQLTEPTIDWPTGMSPAEIDLRRLLTMSDFAHDYRGRRDGSNSPGVNPARRSGLTLENLDHPDLTNFSQDVAGDPAEVYIAPGANTPEEAAGYAAKLPDADAALDAPEFTDLYPNEVLGALAADAMRLSIDREMQIDDRSYALAESSIGPTTPANDRFRLFTGSPFWFGQASGADARTNHPITDLDDRNERRWRSWQQVGRLDITRPIERGSKPDDFGNAVFGLGDLTELLTYRAVNDPERLTRLERASVGLLENGATSSRQTSRRLSPLLVNRPLNLDRFGHGDGRVRGQGQPFPDPRGQIDPESMALFALSPRQRITTLSGAVPLEPGLAAGDLSVGEVAPTVESVIGNPSALYGVFAGSLAPYAGLRQGNTWPAWVSDGDASLLDTSARDRFWSLSYGGNGAEQALTIAAHLALNSADALDGNDVPSAYTLVLDNSARRDLQTELDLGDDRADERLFPWWSDGNRLDAGDNRLAGTGTATASGTSAFDDDRRRVRNVFGVEPQPFLVEAMSLVIYTDSPTTAGGDDDGLSVQVDSGSGLLVKSIDLTPVTSSDLTSITVDTSLDWPNNPDMAIQVLAFKLHNPFDENITLEMAWHEQGNTTNYQEERDHWEPEYYIEYAGRFYALGRFREFDDNASGTGVIDDVVDPNNPADQYDPDKQYTPATIPAGESRVFYALANTALGQGERPSEVVGGPDWDFKAVDERWRALLENGAYGRPATNYEDEPNDERGPAWEWVEDRLKVSGATGVNAPYRIKEFDPQTGKIRGPNDLAIAGVNWRDITTPDPATVVPAIADNPTRINKTGVVRLWRRSGDPRVANTSVIPVRGETNDPKITDRVFNDERYNDIRNDLLADRLYDPAGGLGNSLQISGLPSGSVSNTVSFGEGDRLMHGNPAEENTNADGIYCASPYWVETPGGNVKLRRNDNTGWTMTLWSSFRRRGGSPDDFDSNDTNNFGYLSPSMIAVRPQTEFGTNTNSLNRTDQAESLTDVLGGLDAGAFATLGCGAGTGTDFRDLERYVRQRGDGTTRHTFGGLFSNRARPVDEVLVERVERIPDVMPSTLEGKRLDYDDPDQLQPELFFADGGLDNDKNVSTARPADILLALGVGAVNAPNPARAIPVNATQPDYDPDSEWITLAEATAIALGFDRPDGAPATGTPDEIAAAQLDDPYYGLVNTWSDLNANGTFGETADLRMVLPNLRLAIDDYVPFFDEDGDGVFTPEILSGTDVRAGLGIPMALDAVGRLRMHEAIEPIVSDTDWELTTFVPGLININTAPLAVLRMLPGLTPSFDTYDVDGDLSTTADRRQAYWLAQHDTSTTDKLPNLRGTGVEQVRSRPDVAATIAAYRDRLAPQWRRLSDPSWDPIGIVGAATTPPQAGSIQLRYDPLDAQSVPVGGATSPLNLPARYAMNLQSDAGRSAATGIMGLRESPGFSSLGEVLAVTFADETPFDFGDLTAGSNNNFDNYRHNAVQALGLDGERLPLISVGTGTASFETDTYDDHSEPDEIADEMGERTAVANGILGSVSVSSDIYAVWFVVHGYRRSDVEDLLPGDPLVPSYARRFLMVIDRSNVTSESDEPRVLAFKELPL